MKFFCLFIRTAFAANWIDLLVMRKLLGQKWQNNNKNKTLFSLDFSLHVIAGCIKPSIQSKKFEFLRKRYFYASLKIWSFWKLNPDFEKRYKHRFKTTADAMKGQIIYSHIFVDSFRPVFKTKKLSIWHTSGFRVQILTHVSIKCIGI